MPSVKCAHCDAEHEVGTKFCPSTGKAISLKSNATMMMFRSPGSPLPGSSAENKPAGSPPPAPRPTPTPPAGADTGPGLFRKTTPVTGTSDTLAMPPAGMPGRPRTDPAIPTPVRPSGSRPIIAPSAPVLEVPRPPVAADKVPRPPVDPGLDGVVRTGVTGERSSVSGAHGATGPNRSRSFPSWVAAPEAGGIGTLPTAMFPAVDAPQKSAVALLREALTLYRQHAQVLLVTGLLLYLPAIALTAFFRARMQAPTGMGLRLLLLEAVVIGLVGGLIGSITHAAVSAAAADRLLGGTASVKDHWTWLLARARPLLSALVPAALLVMVGTMLLVIPGLVLTFVFMFVPIVVLFEREAGVSALRRSYELCKSDWQRIGVLCLIFLALKLIPAMLIAAIPVAMVRGILAVVYSILLLPLGALTLLLLYLDNRRTREGFDKEALRAQLDSLRSPP